MNPQSPITNHQCADAIADRIRAQGPLTVAAFMALALYHPELGYYASAARRTGRRGDFFTSVDVGPLFGRLLARQFAGMWRATDGGPFDLVEAGAANGQLARDVLDAAANDDAFYDALRVHLVEASPAARKRHPDTLGPHAAKLISSAAGLPDGIHGVIYANELLDALPVHQVVMTPDGLRETYVDLAPGQGGQAGDTPPPSFVDRIGPLSHEGLARHLTSLGVALQPGWRAEINLSALAWVARACQSLHRGFLLLIDYGHSAEELYSETHATGTLTAFSRHRNLGGQTRVRPGSDPGLTPGWIEEPGTRDITSHVDLTSVRQVAERLGCDTLGVLDQTYFLMALAGLTESREGPGPIEMDAHDLRAFKTLILPGGLGSTQKVMLFGREVGRPALQGLSGRVRVT
ncbi:MAG: hypothetical protein FJW23_08940 [Acidimicrobiia bacterium]|nr:hypothetical protein [Acidimicrobiia bacterium]